MSWWLRAALVSAATTLASPAAAAPRPTFTADIAPIVYRACATCHRAGGDGPFSLLTYEDVRRHAAQIAAVTQRRLMPPWKPAAGVGDFLGERRLTNLEIAAFDEWVRAGTPEGDPAALPPLPPSPNGWLHGKPDLVLELPAYTLAADGPDVFRNFVVTVPGRETRYVRTLEFRPRSRGVHHANIRIDRTLASRRLDAADPEPGYEGVILRSADYPDGHFLGWTPGQAPPPPTTSDLSWRLDGGSDFVVQLHMRPTGKPEVVQPLIGLYFGEKPTRVPTMIRLGRQNLDIPAGARDYRVADSFTVPVDVQVHAIQPHAHYRARRVDVWATLPDGARRPLLRIDDWDFNWQDDYRYAVPFWLPAGTTIAMEYAFDNSADNPRNPTRPPSRVSWGWRSADEMADVWVQVIARPADRDRLQTDADLKMLTEDSIGGEVLVREHPDYAALRNDVALTYMNLGNAEKAFEHFHAVTQLEPESAPAWFNEGSALELGGRRAEARQRFERAIELNPSYAAAYVKVGGLLLAEGRFDEAQRSYERAVRTDATNADAHANLALVLAQQGRSDAALTQMREAVRLQPLRARQVTSFVWLLAANADPAARRPAEAREFAERLVEATGRRDADALDALAAAYAALGRFDDAIATATEALSLPDVTRGVAQAADIREHIARYRRREAVTLQR